MMLSHALIFAAVLGSGPSMAPPVRDDAPASKSQPRQLLAIDELAGLLGFVNMRDVYADGTLVWRKGGHEASRAQLPEGGLSDLIRQLDRDAARSAIESLRWSRHNDSVGLVISYGTVVAEVPFNEVPTALRPAIAEMERLFTEQFGDDYTPLTFAGSREVPQACTYWRTLLDASQGEPAGPGPVDKLDEAATLDAMRCLLDMQGDQHRARSDWAARLDTGQLLPPATVEIAALYYVSCLFEQRWDHAGGVALRGQDGTLNDPLTVRIAYHAYRSWLKKVELIGLGRARQKRLRPFVDTSVGWY
jgi:hypothetical protein